MYSFSRMPYAELRFHLCLPWLALRSTDATRSNVDSLQSPSTINDAIHLLLDVTTHFAKYKSFRDSQYQMLDKMGSWLQAYLAVPPTTHPVDVADQINDSRKSSQILAAWNALADESSRPRGELISNITQSLQDFEKEAIIMPIASEMLRNSQFPILELGIRSFLRYSEIWEWISMGLNSIILSKSLDQHQFRRLLAAISNHRATYMMRQAVVDLQFDESIAAHQDIQENPILLTAFSMPKALAMQVDVAAVGSIRKEDFIWPDQGVLLTNWCRGLHDAALLDARQTELDVTSLLDGMAI